VKVLLLNPGADTAGLAYGMKLALEKSGDEARVVTMQRNYIAYPMDIRWDWPTVRQLYAWCDIVILANHATTYGMLDSGQHKPVIIYHHGTMFRTDAEEVWAEGEAIGAAQAVSTVDLLLSVPKGKHAHWIPQVIDERAMAAIRRENFVEHQDIVVAHSPTNRAVKGTEAFLGAFRRAERRDRRLRLLMIEWETWASCLRKKATADIFVDQFNLGYGLNSVEAWAMGLPVIAGATPEILARMRQEYGGDVPFMETSLAEAEDHMVELAGSPTLRKRYAALGREHVRRFHSQQAVAKRLHAIFPTVPRSHGVSETAELELVG
jgi:hypothetical protein